MNAVGSSRNLRPNGLKTGGVLQFLVGLVACIWLVYQITQSQQGSVKTKISENEGVNSLGRKHTAGQLNVRGENLEAKSGEGEMVEGESSSAEGENIQVNLQGGKRGEIAYSDETNKNDEGSSSNQGDLQGGKRVEIAYSDETNKNDEGSSSKVSENLLETVTSYKGSDGKDVLQDKDEQGIDQDGEENSMTHNATVRSQYDVFSDGHSFHDENGIPKEMRHVKFAGSSSLNDQSESS